MLFRDDRFYRPDEVAKVLAIKTRTVYRKINDINDPLPACRPTGTALRIPGKQLNEYLERHKVNPLEE